MDKYKSEKRKYAKRLLLHYFTIAIGAEDMDLEMQSEIEDIVDLIIDSAIVETIKELRNEEYKNE
jgi:hypothetical protein